MSELRLMLLAAGIVLIIGIYLYTRRAQNRSTARNTQRREPRFETFVSDSDDVPPLAAPVTDADVADASLSGPNVSDRNLSDRKLSDRSPPKIEFFEQADLPLPEELRPEPYELSGTDSAAGDKADTRRQKVIVIHVSARGGNRFQGADIVSAMDAESLEFGEFDIFHRRAGRASLFSVASMVEPGKFDMTTINSLSTPGLSLFLLLPGPDSPVAAFTEMLSTARRLATALGGEVLDESGSSLSRQAASHLREQIIEFAHRIR